MFLSRTFSIYVGRQFLLWTGAIILVLVAIVEIFDVLELFRRTSKNEGGMTGVVATMALLKMSNVIERIIPFAVLFGAMFTFSRLNRHQELVVARAAGVSAWQFLLPMIILAFTIGVFQITAFNPFAATMLLQYEKLEAKYIRGRSSLAAVSDEGLWLRQRTPEGHYLLHASEVIPQAMELRKVIVFRMRDPDRFVERIDAPKARLEKGYWLLWDVRVNNVEDQPQRHASYNLATDLTLENINDSFAPPETLSIWTLPHFVAVLERAGFSALRHRIHWQSKLAQPLLLCAMVLLAAMFSLRHVRRGGAMVMIAIGIGAGFVLFFMTDVVAALGSSGSIPVLLAAWSPAIISTLLGTAVLFHLEDG